MSEQKPIRILVVDDDENVRRLVAAYLEREGYEVLVAADGHAAVREAEAGSPDLVVLDLMLPGMSGLQVAKRLTATREIPILMLTARGEEEDQLRGFQAGADDYLTKPFSPKILVARVSAILRRAGLGEEQGQKPIVAGDLTIDPLCREVKVSGQPAELTAIEFDLLRALAEHPGWVYSREQLLERVWGYDYLGDSRVVDVHIANLRKKIGDDPSEPSYIRTVRGVGYKFQPRDKPVESAAGPEASAGGALPQ
ncbi:MAG: response regulator transcription factor [Thermoleophilia bacterium]|nr:response regulator transcription factor [Thermoleophilia bacterium]